MPCSGNVSPTVAKLLVVEMKVKTPEVKEDPELKRQQEAAAQEKVTTIQQRLSSDTDSALRRFGTRQSVASGAGGSTTQNRLLEAIMRGAR